MFSLTLIYIGNYVIVKYDLLTKYPILNYRIKWSKYTVKYNIFILELVSCCLLLYNLIYLLYHIIFRIKASSREQFIWGALMELEFIKNESCWKSCWKGWLKKIER